MSANHKADAAWDDYVFQQQEEKIEQLERELNTAQRRIKRLEEAGDRMRLYCADPDDCFAWDRAKETKP